MRYHQRIRRGHIPSVRLLFDGFVFDSGERSLRRGGEAVHLTPKAFQLLFFIGRHRRIDVFAASWRPFGLPPFLRGCADEVRAFQTTEPLDLDWYAKSCSESFAAALPKLRARRSLVWTPGATTSAAPAT